VAVVEVCGFNDWLLKLLPEFGCRELVLVQPEERDRRKTDRRDSHRLGADRQRATELGVAAEVLRLEPG